jgi:hypothetical protein
MSLSLALRQSSLGCFVSPTVQWECRPHIETADIWEKQMRELKMVEVEAVSGGEFSPWDPTTWADAYNDAIQAVTDMMCRFTGACS